MKNNSNNREPASLVYGPRAPRRDDDAHIKPDRPGVLYGPRSDYVSDNKLYVPREPRSVVYGPPPVAKEKYKDKEKCGAGKCLLYMLGAAVVVGILIYFCL